MRQLDYLFGGFAFLALPLFIWWGIYQSPASAVNLEARLEARAAAALTAAGFDWAGLHMDGQRAVLAGDAPSEDAVMEAASQVRRSSGPGGILFGGVTLVERRTGHAAPVSPYVWEAEKTEAGLIVLSGHVPSNTIRRSLVEEVRLTGRSAVEDRMVLTAGAPAGNFQGIARLVIAELSRVERGRAEIRDYRVRFEGEVSDPAVRRRVMTAISGIAAPFEGQPMLAGRADWQAVINGQGLTLSGRIAGEAERSAILALARESFDGQVIDAMEMGGVADVAKMAGLAAALPHFADFRTGNMRYDGEGGGFTFSGEAAPSVLHFLREDLARAPLRSRSVFAAEPVRAQAVMEAEAVLMPASMAAGSSNADAICEAALQGALRAGPVGFVAGSDRFSRDSAPALDALAGAAGQCPPGLSLELALSAGDSEAGLAEARGAALADYLTRTGIARPRIAVITGQAAPDEAGGRIVTIRVRERSSE
ncbi:MAG: hypothetical protein ACK46Q_06300 [Hyphomonas sp.]